MSNVGSSSNTVKARCPERWHVLSSTTAVPWSCIFLAAVAAALSAAWRACPCGALPCPGNSSVLAGVTQGSTESRSALLTDCLGCVHKQVKGWACTDFIQNNSKHCLRKLLEAFFKPDFWRTYRFRDLRLLSCVMAACLCPGAVWLNHRDQGSSTSFVTKALYHNYQLWFYWCQCFLLHWSKCP